MHLHTIDQFAICRYAAINDRSICVCRGDRLLFMHLLKCQKKLRCMQHTYIYSLYVFVYVYRSINVRLLSGAYSNFECFDIDDSDETTQIEFDYNNYRMSFTWRGVCPHSSFCHSVAWGCGQLKSVPSDFFSSQFVNR